MNKFLNIIACMEIICAFGLVITGNVESSIFCILVAIGCILTKD